eukprot:1319878-Pleurochrysis_carterae.AAC.1
MAARRRGGGGHRDAGWRGGAPDCCWAKSLASTLALVPIAALLLRLHQAQFDFPPQTPDDVGAPVNIWWNKVGNDVRHKLGKLKQAEADPTFKVSPTPLSVFKELHNYMCELQPQNKGRHLSNPKQVCGQRGGNQHWTFDLLSGDMVAAFFTSTFVFGMNQGSLLVRDNGTVLAVIAPMTFTYKVAEAAGKLNEPVMTVVVDVATLPVYGVFRDASAEYSAQSKDHMKTYIARQLRAMLNSFHSMESDNPNHPITNILLTKPQMVQIRHYAPERAPQAQGATFSSLATAANEPAP